MATKASFNLLGGFAEFDHDFSAVNDGVNDNIYSISSRLHGDVFSKGADYCDGGGNTSKPAGKGGYCLEVDWIESNGKCGGATAIHDVPGRNASRSPLGRATALASSFGFWPQCQPAESARSDSRAPHLPDPWATRHR